MDKHNIPVSVLTEAEAIAAKTKTQKEAESSRAILHEGGRTDLTPDQIEERNVDAFGAVLSALRQISETNPELSKQFHAALETFMPKLSKETPKTPIQ